MASTLTPGTRVRIGGDAVALFGRVGTVIGRSVHPDAWMVELDPSSDILPGDYYARGGRVAVQTSALATA